jgi:hypothetical protein
MGFDLTNRQITVYLDFIYLKSKKSQSQSATQYECCTITSLGWLVLSKGAFAG